MKYKVGDKVRVREDLGVDKWYGDQKFVDGMERFRGKTVEIDDTWNYGHTLKEDEESWVFSDEMFKPIEDPLVAKQEVLTDEQIARKVDQAYKDGYEKGKQHATEKQSEETETVASVLADYFIASAKLKLALKMEVKELEE